jgi:hypothetical protein
MVISALQHQYSDLQATKTLMFIQNDDHAVMETRASIQALQQSFGALVTPPAQADVTADHTSPAQGVAATVEVHVLPDGLLSDTEYYLPN